MSRKNIEEVYPLSPMQQGMFFHTLYAPSSGVYVEQLSCVLAGHLDPVVFRLAWQSVVDRHPVLRTAFVGTGLKEPIQVVYRDVQVDIEQMDWRTRSPSVQEADFDQWTLAQQEQGLELTKAPVMRLILIRLEDEAWRFVWIYHHMLLDGWSVPLLFSELLPQYEALRKGKTLQLEPAPRFRQYLSWLRRQDVDEAERFWRAEMEGMVTPTPLPPGRSPADIQRQRTGTREVEVLLTAEQTAGLQAFAREHQLTVNTLVQGAWAVLLSRHSGEDDVTFGVTVSGRPPQLPGSERMLGLFINTLPARFKVPPRERVADWLRQIQARQVEVRQYEYCSLIQIQGWSQVPRDMPLFDSILAFENFPVQERLKSHNGSLGLRDVRSLEQTNYALNLVAGVGDQLMLRFVYEISRYEGVTVSQLLGQLTSILLGMIRNPDQQLFALPLLTEQEHKLVVEDWNNTGRPFPDDISAKELFERQVARTPDLTALQCGEQALTYAELDRRANRLARYLRNQGVGKEAIVAICARPSVDMITAVLAVHKAGGAYVPLDPTYPPDRIEFMIQDAKPKALLTQADLAEIAPAGDYHLFCLDSDWPQVEAFSDERLDDVAGPDSLAYIIYTSGSTGKPKGVLVEHRGLCNLCVSLAELYPMGPGRRVLMFASFGFDASVADIFGALTSGSTLHVAPREKLMSVPDLLDLLRRERITTMLVPPAMLAVLPPVDLPDLETVITGGEACPPEAARAWCASRRLFNAYGPTETTVIATTYLVKELDEYATAVPIGSPLPNTQCFVMDDMMNPLPVGVAGELCIGGVGVARGYLDRPELTAERFVPCSFDSCLGDTLYKTGDLVRWRMDGTLEFLGRIDNQVKIRGFRVELGEIEAVLSEHEDVADAVVAVHKDAVGGPRLVAYPRFKEGAQDGISELRDYLRDRLPGYMVPSSFVVLDEYPLTPSGKVDRANLPPPPSDRSGLGQPYVAPRDALEAQLVSIWEEVLGAEEVGVTDDFFDLGGHSLLAVRLVALAEERLGRQLSLAELFQQRTVEQQAALLRKPSSEADPEAVLVHLRKGDEERPFFFVHPSGGSVHWYADLARRLRTGHDFWGIQAYGLAGGGTLDASVEAMAERYVDAILEVQPDGPYHLAGWSFGVIVAYETARQLWARGKQVGFVGVFDQGPVMPYAEPASQAEYLFETFSKNVPLSLEKLESLGYGEQIDYVYQEAKSIGWVLPQVTLSMFRGLVLIMRTQADAWRNYRPRPYPGRVTVFRAAQEDESQQREPDLGWGSYAIGGVDVRQVPGDHISMLQTPLVRTLAREMADCLAKAEEAASVETGALR